MSECCFPQTRKQGLEGKVTCQGDSRQAAELGFNPGLSDRSPQGKVHCLTLASYRPLFLHRGGVPGPCYGSTTSGHWLLSHPTPASLRPQLGASEDPKRTSQTPCGYERTINRSRHSCLRVSSAHLGDPHRALTLLALSWAPSALSHCIYHRKVPLPL